MNTFRNSLQALRSHLPGSGYHDRVRGARGRREADDPVRHRHDQVHLLRSESPDSLSLPAFVFAAVLEATRKAGVVRTGSTLTPALLLQYCQEACPVDAIVECELPCASLLQSSLWADLDQISQPKTRSTRPRLVRSSCTTRRSSSVRWLSISLSCSSLA